MLIALSVCFSMLGLAALSLAMDRHHTQVFRRAPAKRSLIMLRLAALVLLAGSLALAVIDMGAPTGITFWTGLLSLCALAVVLAQGCLQRRRHPQQRQAPGRREASNRKTGPAE